MAKGKRTLGIGLVGMGFMGLTHLRASRRLRGGRVVGIVTSDPRKARGDFSAVRGNVGRPGSRENLEGIRVHPTLDDLLADDRVDLVDICLPTYLHTTAAIRAMKGGKSVLVEKPIALKVRDAERMIATSERTGSLLMVAHTLKFSPEFTSLSSAIRTERYGRLRSLHLRRVVAKPSWGDDDWFGDPRLSGGLVVDLHIHDTDFTVHLMGGKPRAVTSHGLRAPQFESIRTVYHYGANGPLLSAEAGWINAPSLPFEQGYDAFFERATIQFNSTHCPRPRLYTARKPRDLSVPAIDAFASELEAALDSTRRGAAHPLLSAETATASLQVCLAEERSARNGVSVDLP